MKRLFISVFLSFLIHPCFSQNILEALRLQEDSIEKYVEGEFYSTDTIVDLRNGYYEEFHSWSDQSKLILRQAAIFNNDEGSKLLGISVCSYDFVCMLSKTSFYEVSKSQNSIKPISPKAILPQLTYQDFLKDISQLSELKDYLRKQDLTDSGFYDDFDEYLNESGIFAIKYSMPRKGTSLIANIDVCDHFLGREEWLRLKGKYFKEVFLKYDGKLKTFQFAGNSINQN